MKKGYFLQNLQDTRLHAILALAVVTLFIIPNVFFLIEQINTKFDDAYMFIRYAVNFLNGHGIAWNPDGIQTYGVTSLLYLLVIITGRWLFPLAGDGAVLSVSSFVIGLLVLVAVTAGSIKAATSEFFRKYRLLFPVFATIVLMSSDHYRLHSVSGMDTTLSILCNTLLIVATIAWVGKPSRFSLTQLVIASYVCFLTRPDTLVYAILFPIMYGWFFLHEERIRTLSQFGLAIAAMLLLDMLAKFWIFGDPLPLPFYTKSAGYLDGYRDGSTWNPVSYLFIFFKEMFPFIVILVFSATKKSWRLILAFFVPVILTLAYFFSVTQIMGFWARYYFPALPFFAMGSFMVLDQRLHDPIPRLSLNFTIRGAVAILTAVFLFLPVSQSVMETVYESRLMPVPRIYKSAISRELDGKFTKLGWWTSITAMAEISSQLPAGTHIAMSEYGFVGAKSPQIYIIDLIGLNDPVFAHSGFSSEELFRRNPDIIWFPPPAYTKTVALIQDDPTLLAEYDYYPGAFDTGLAVRRGSGHYELIMKIVTTVWSKYYDPDVEMESYPYK